MDKITGLALEVRLFLGPLPDVVLRLSYVRRLERVWQLIEAEYGDAALTLGKAALVSGTSKNHLNVLFNTRTGLTFHQILVRYRLLKSIAMMEAKNFSFLEIALENGFGSLTSFERNFRYFMGRTPREFKTSRDF
jgi:AraC-like DNA-binding protein